MDAYYRAGDVSVSFAYPLSVFARDRGFTCRSCALGYVLAARLKCKWKSVMGGFFRKNSIFFDPYIGIQVADSIYGVSPEFIGAVENLPGITYFVSIPKKTLCWLKRPMTLSKRYRWGGKVRTKTVLADTDSKPGSVSDLAKNINDYFWYRRQVSEGAKGPIVYEFTRRRVILSASGLPEKTVWLLIRRTIGDNPQYSYFISNAPRSTRLKALVWLSGLRWAIEQCFEEAKTELGMDHYEVRKFMGWHHHILTCIMAHFFLWHLKIRLGKKSTIYYAIAA